MNTSLKGGLISLARCAARTYIHSPWNFGKRAVYDAYCRNFGWRHYRKIVKTRFGDLMEINTPDVISTTIFLAGHWEPMITEYVRGALNPGDTFIDIGANIGYYTVLASRMVGDSGSVISIEAHPGIYDRLKKNVALNDRKNVRIINAAAGSSRGELPIFSGPEINLGHTTTVATIADSEGLRCDGMVRSDTLESLVGMNSLYNARLIKVDVEGAEYEVLSTIFDSLAQFSPTTEWILELAPENCPAGRSAIHEIYAAFRSAGYEPFKIDNPYGFHQLERTRNIKFTPISDAMQDEWHDVLMTRKSQTKMS